MKRRLAGIFTWVTLLIFSMMPSCAKHELSSGNSGIPGRLAAYADGVQRYSVLTAIQKVSVKEVESASRQVESVVKTNDGYIQNQSLREEDSAYLTLRVPPPHVKPVLDAVAALGTEEARSISSQDVTEQYIDTEARLKNAIALRDRLKSLLGQANSVKDILEIEKELTRVQSDIDSMQARLKSLKGQVDLAQIDLTLERKKILGPVGYIFTELVGL